MPQDGHLQYEESFNSFLAGVLLTRRKINNFEFLTLMSVFEKTYNVSVVSLGGDIFVPIYFDDNGISLYKDMDDVISIKGESLTVRNYLYSFTTSRIREFFGIPELILEEKKTNSLVKKLFRNNYIKSKIAV